MTTPLLNTEEYLEDWDIPYKWDIKEDGFHLLAQEPKLFGQWVDITHFNRQELERFIGHKIEHLPRIY